MAKTKRFPEKSNKRNDNFFNKVTKKHIKNLRPDTKSTPNDFFVKPRFQQSEDIQKQVQPQKKTFNKTKWREEKYSLKNKLDAWKSKRVDYIKHEYNKEKNRSKNISFNVNKIYEEEENRQENDFEDESQDEETQSKKTKNKWLRREKRILEMQEEKDRKREEFIKKKAEREEALKRYRQKKIEKQRKLNKKTKKGQPIMKGRMELLLEQIQESMNS